MTTYTIETAKGRHSSNSLHNVCRWQARNQGSFASVLVSVGDEPTVQVIVDEIDFDLEDIEVAVSAVSALIAAESEQF